MLLGSANISSRPDNQGSPTDARLFVGVGSPNPLLTRLRRFRTAADQFPKIDVLGARVDISSRPDNQSRPTDPGLFVGVGSPNPLLTRLRRFRTAVGRFSKIDVLGARVDISSRPDNQSRPTDARLFVGVGSPNPLLTRLRRFRTAVGRFSKINVLGPRYEYRPTVDSTLLGFQSALVNGRGNLAPTIEIYPRIMDTPHINVNTP